MQKAGNLFSLWLTHLLGMMILTFKNSHRASKENYKNLNHKLAWITTYNRRDSRIICNSDSTPNLFKLVKRTRIPKDLSHLISPKCRQWKAIRISTVRRAKQDSSSNKNKTEHKCNLKGQREWVTHNSQELPNLKYSIQINSITIMSIIKWIVKLSIN